MEEKRKLYDAILTEGARWLALRQRENRILGIKNIQLSTLLYLFLEIARVCSVYDKQATFCVKCNIFTYMYLKYIKRFKFLKRPPKTDIEYINTNLFLSELTNYFNQPFSIFEEIYNYYFRR